jgi:hypothetical protein
MSEIAWLRQLSGPTTESHSHRWKSGCLTLAGADAYQLVLFQVALGALHIDVLVGGKLRSDPIICSGTGFDVLAAPKFKSSFQIFAD